MLLYQRHESSKSCISLLTTLSEACRFESLEDGIGGYLNAEAALKGSIPSRRWESVLALELDLSWRAGDGK